MIRTLKLNRLFLPSLCLFAFLPGCQTQQTVAANQPPQDGSQGAPSAPPKVDPANAATRGPSPPQPATAKPDPQPPPASLTQPKLPVRDTGAKTLPPKKKAETKPKNAMEIPVDPAELKRAQETEDKLDSQAMRIQPTNTDDWTTSKYSADFVCQVMSAKIRKMQDTVAHIVAVVKNPDGTGNFNQTLKIRDHNVFKVPFVDVGATTTNVRYPTIASEMVSNGKFKMELLGIKWQPRVLTSQKFKDFPPSAEKLALTLDRNFTRLVYAGIADNEDVWNTAMAQWQKGVGGYTITVEERLVPIVENNVQYHIKQYRVHLVRGEVAAKTLGASEMEIVVDNDWGLPVTFRSTSSSPPTAKGKVESWQIFWGAAYQNKQKFTDQDFGAPYNKK